jgi:hypothetical protein
MHHMVLILAIIRGFQDTIWHEMNHQLEYRVEQGIHLISS